MAVKIAPTNMRILSPSRKRRKVGEIFVLSVVCEGEYYWGRVVSLDMDLMGWKRTILTYVYNTKTNTTDPIPELSRDNLLIPPFGIANLPWSRGYFQTIAQRPLAEGDVLSQHCFKHPWDKIEEYYDEFSNRLPGRIEPCGIHALRNYRTVDDEISKALGIPMAPDWETHEA